MINSQVFPKELYEAFGLSVEKLMPMQTGYRNHNYPARLSSGEPVNLIVYKSEPDMAATLKSAHYVAEYLAASGFSVRTLRDRRILRVRNGDADRLAAVYDYLPGETIPWEAYTREHIKTLGGTLSDMHAALAQLPRGPLPLATERSRMLISRMRDYFNDEGVRTAMGNKLRLEPVPSLHFRFMEWIFARADSLPAQPLHLDFVRGNILFEPDTKHVTGILDFEKAAYGPVLLDVARTLAFLLVDCKYKAPEKVRKYFLFSGYQKRGAAELPRQTLSVGDQPVDLLEAFVDFFLVYDFYKFLRHNPYESLRQNEHFLRTRDLLLARRQLSAAPGVKASAMVS